MIVSEEGRKFEKVLLESGRDLTNCEIFEGPCGQCGVGTSPRLSLKGVSPVGIFGEDGAYNFWCDDCYAHYVNTRQRRWASREDMTWVSLADEQKEIRDEIVEKLLQDL